MGGVQLNQLNDDVARSKLSTIAGEELDNLMTLLNDKLDFPIDISISGYVITIEAGIKQKLESDSLDGTQNSFKWRLPHIESVSIDPAESTIDLSDGSTTGDFINNPSSSVSLTSSYYIQMGVELRQDGKYYVIWGDEAATSGATTFPGFSKSKAIPVFIGILQDDGTGGTWNLSSPSKSDIQIMKGAAGGGGGAGGAGLGSDLGDLLYRASFEDSFSDKDLIDENSGKTTGIFDASNEYFKISYDADKTGTTTGTSLVVSAAPAYTVAIGDIIWTTISSNKEARKITALGSINTDGGSGTPATIEIAFSGDITVESCCISQAVHTVDMLNYIDTSDEESQRLSHRVGHIALTNVSNGVSDSVDHSESSDWLTPATDDIVLKDVSGTLFETTITSITDSDTFVLADTTGFSGDGDGAIVTPLSKYLLNYLDSGFVGNIDVVAQVITSSDSASNWSDEPAISRKQNYQDELQENTISGTSGAHLYSRFFANKTSGSGEVKLYEYQSFFIDELNQANGGIHQQASGRTDGVGTEINCSLSVVATKTRITFTDEFPGFIPGVNPGKTHGELIVILNGSHIPRFVDSTITNNEYYNEDSNGSYIDLDQDYSGSAYEFTVLKMLGTKDTSSDNAAKLGSIRYVGTDYSTIEAAVAGSIAGDKIIIQNNTYLLSSNIVVDKQLVIEFQPGVILDGSAAGTKGFSVTADDVIFKMNGALMQDWDSGSDYSIYYETGADRGKVQNGRFSSTNDNDIFVQPDTAVTDCIGNI